MLFNPHQNAPSMSSFEYWLEGKESHERYPYRDIENCACAQYLKAIGKYHGGWLSEAKDGSTLGEMNSLAGGGFWTIAELDGFWTFGELLHRVRAYNDDAALK